MPYSMAERMCMVETYIKYATYAERKAAFSQLFPKAEVPSRRTFQHWIQLWRETGTVRDKERQRKRTALTDEKVAAISELLAKNPRMSLRQLSAHTGVSLGSVFLATKLLKLRAYEESVGNEFQAGDCQENEVSEKNRTAQQSSMAGGKMLGDLNANVKEKIDEPGQDSDFSAVWVKVEKDEEPALSIPDEDPLTEATTSCTKDSLLAHNSAQSSRESGQNVQETSLKVLHERGSVQNKKLQRDRTVLTDQKLSDISELLRKNPRISLRCLSAQAGISLASAFTATRMLKLCSEEESAVNDLRADNTQQNDFYGKMSSDLNANVEEKKIDDLGQDRNFSAVWVKVEKDEEPPLSLPDQDPLTQPTSTCMKESLLTYNSAQSSRETGQNVQERNLSVGLKSLLELLQTDKSCDCNVCGKTFRNQYQLCKHKLIHTQERSHACKICNKVFVRKECMKKHLKTHTGERPYQCQRCNVSFKSKSDRKKHMALHKEKTIHVCKICGKSFALKRYLNAHKKTHTQGKPYCCQVCNKSFHRKKNLKKHLQSHYAVDASELCETNLDDSYYLQRHKRRMSSNEMNCNVVCNESVSDANELDCTIVQTKGAVQKTVDLISDNDLQKKKHLKENLEMTGPAQDSSSMASGKVSSEFLGNMEKEKIGEYGEEMDFSAVWVKVEKDDEPLLSIPDKDPLREATSTCPENSLLACNLAQSSREAGENVQQTTLDTGEKDLLGLPPSEKTCSCDVCGKTFRKPFRMHRHRLTHTQEKSYACKLCNKAFTRKDCMKVHLKTHTVDRPYHRGLCHRSYKSKGDREKHMAVHKEKSIQICEICGKSFTLKRYLKIHKKTHVQEKPCCCEICNKSFQHKETLKKHLQSHQAVNTSEMYRDGSYYDQRHKRRMKENSEEIDLARETSSMASENVSDEFNVGLDGHKFGEGGEEMEFSEDPLMVEKEKNLLAPPDKNFFSVASTIGSQDFIATGISGKSNVKVKEEKSDPPEEKMEFSEVRVKVENEDYLPISDQCLIPEATSNNAKDFILACKKEQPSQEVDEHAMTCEAMCNKIVN